MSKENKKPSFSIKTISFILDICPIVGGIKMIIEAIVGKEMTGTILVGMSRFAHFLFGLVSLALDGVTGVGGSVTRGLAKVFAKGFLRKSLRRVVVVGAKSAGKGAVRTGLLAAKKGVVRGVTRLEANALGKVAIKKLESYAEKKIRKTAEHTLGSIHGYRFSDKKRQEFRDKYGLDVDNKEDAKIAHQMTPMLQKIVKEKYGYDVKKDKQASIKP